MSENRNDEFEVTMSGKTQDKPKSSESLSAGFRKVEKLGNKVPTTKVDIPNIIMDTVSTGKANEQNRESVRERKTPVLNNTKQIQTNHQSERMVVEENRHSEKGIEENKAGEVIKKVMHGETSVEVNSTLRTKRLDGPSTSQKYIKEERTDNKQSMSQHVLVTEGLAGREKKSIRKPKGKKIVYIVLLAVVICIAVIIGLYTGCSTEDTFQKLDWYDACGDKLIAYDVENDKYTSKYIPSELCAKTVDEVGCVLKLDITYTSSTYRNITNMQVSTVRRSGEIINAEIINLHTGKIMAKEKFVAEQPDKTTSSGTDYVEKEIVKQWVQSNFVAPKVEKLTKTDETAPPKEIIPEVQEEPVRLSALAGNVAQVVPMPDGVIAILYTDGKVKVVGNEQLSVTVSQWQNVKYLSGDVTHLAGLKENGIVVSSKFNTSDWRNIEKLFCWEDKIAGITVAGEVRAVGFKDGCDPDGLTNIQDICVLGDAVYAITKAGEVIQHNFAYIDPVIDRWNNVEKLYADGGNLLAMFNDGSYASANGEDVSELRDAERIAWDDLSEGWLGVSDDGNLLVTSKVRDCWAKWGGFSQISNVKDIIALNYNHWAFVLMDGTVIEIEPTRNFCCENWENVEKIAVIQNSFGHVDACYGLKSDGSVIKRTNDETDNYKSWDLVDLFECKDAYVSVEKGKSVRVLGGIVGLTKNGKIVAEGSYRQANVDLLNEQP